MDSNETKVALCENFIGYEFKNKLLCLEALQASGHTLSWQGDSLTINRNDKLAILGVAVARAHLCTKWYTNGGSKGQWSQIEQELLTNSNLGAVGHHQGFFLCVILNMGTVDVSVKTMATTVQAIMGAAYLDGGTEALEKVFEVLNLHSNS